MTDPLPTTSAENPSGPAPGHSPVSTTLETRRVLRTWWPLAASWVLMGLEGPAVSAVVSRLADPKINLAAWGGVVFPLALMVEAPIIMMLAASTALCRDWPSYVKLRRFMTYLGAALTATHLLIAATPLYYVVTRQIIGVPEAIIEPARWGLLIMTPWTWSIAYRRFQQGVLIRFGGSLKVGLGTAVRFAADALVLALGYALGKVPGIVVAACTMSAGVMVEASYARVAVRRTLREKLRSAPPSGRTLTTRAMLAFYLPLSLTQVLMLVVNPIASAAMSRMPLALESLAAWPVAAAINYITRGAGGAFNEVVVALVEEPRSTRVLRRFGAAIAAGSTVFLALLLVPPVSNAIFAGLLDLADPLPTLIWHSMFILLPMPALAVAQSYFQGVILHGQRTRSVTESVALSLVVISLALLGGVLRGRLTGLYVAIGALVLGDGLRTVWLWARSFQIRGRLRERDQQSSLARPA